MAVYAQEKADKYSLKSPGGIAFSDFKGYEDGSVVSSARTDEVLKVIVANPIMIKAYKSGIPGQSPPSRAAPDFVRLHDAVASPRWSSTITDQKWSAPWAAA